MMMLTEDITLSHIITSDIHVFIFNHTLSSVLEISNHKTDLLAIRVDYNIPKKLHYLLHLTMKYKMIRYQQPRKILFLFFV